MDSVATARKIKSGVIKISENVVDYYSKKVMVPEIKEVAIRGYDSTLLNTVTDRESKSNPNLYRDDFEERLNGFEFIVPTPSAGIEIMIPTIDNFDFSGRLKVIERIMIGTAGNYVELNENDYVSVFNKNPVNEEPLYEYVSSKERIYLIRYTASVAKAERSLSKRFVKFPFSNTPPIDIFKDVRVYISNSISRWTGEIRDMIYNNTKRNYKGARF